MDDLARHHWLYIRGDESIHVTRLQFKVRVAGPRATEQLHLFNEGAAVEIFLGWYGEALRRDGWVLQAYVDRRDTEAARAPYAGPDRRRPRVLSIEEPE
jgi:hypothetical protein